MARIIDSMDLAKFGEKVTSCPKCKKVIACFPNEVFLDLSYGQGHFGEESIVCPQCHSILHLNEFHTVEHM
jgi:hypothetical protein